MAPRPQPLGHMHAPRADDAMHITMSQILVPCQERVSMRLRVPVLQQVVDCWRTRTDDEADPVPNRSQATNIQYGPILRSLLKNAMECLTWWVWRCGPVGGVDSVYIPTKDAKLTKEFPWYAVRIDDPTCWCRSLPNRYCTSANDTVTILHHAS